MLLTIAIPVYNGGKTIETTLRSIVTQSGNDYEIVVSDNASTDETPEIISKYMAKYSNIRYFRNAENMGPDRNYDLALRRGSGEYVWLMGDDDIMTSGAVEKVQTVIAKHPHVDYFFANCSMWRRDFSECLLAKFIPVENDMVCETADKFFSLVGLNAALTPTTVIRKYFWIGNPDTCYMGTNWHLLSKLFYTLQGHVSCIIANPLVQFRDGSTETHKDGKFYEMVLVLLGLIDQLPSLGYAQETFLKLKKPLLKNMPITIAFEKIFGLKLTWGLIRKTSLALRRYRLVYVTTLILLLLPKQFYLIVRQIVRIIRSSRKYINVQQNRYIQ